jgi:AcrR family transcriptional regulator
VEPSHILDAAEEVFSREGLKAASLRAIAQKAGCDPALIYYHFDSKEAMLGALLMRSMPAMAEDMRVLADPADARPMPLRIWNILQIYKRHTGHHCGLRAVIHGEIARGAEGIRDLMVNQIRKVAESVWAILRQGIERGELRPDLDVEITSIFLARMYLDLLDLVPVMAAQLIGRPAEELLPKAEISWFHFFWRATAVHPDAPIPDLPPIS